MTRHRFVLATATLTALVFAPACTLFTGPAIDLDIDITAVVTQAEQVGGATVSFTVTNVGDTPLWLARCGDRLMTFVDLRIGGSWNYYRGDYCQAVYVMSPLELAPGVTHAGSRRIQEAGHYRLRFGTAADPAEPTNWTIASPSFGVY